MNSFLLKLIACITMLIDHVGSIFFPNIMIFRVIGRVSFPIYAFLITEGYTRTKNLKRYIFRLLILAIISQVPYMSAFEVKGLNIFFTLLAGILVILILDKKINFTQLSDGNRALNKIFEVGINIGKFAIIALILYILDRFEADYGVYGVCMILCFGIFKYDFKKLVVNIAILNLLYTIPILKYFITPYGINYRVFLQATCISSLFFIYNYDGTEGKKIKWLFYGFYPIHLAVLIFIRYILENVV